MSPDLLEASPNPEVSGGRKNARYGLLVILAAIGAILIVVSIPIMYVGGARGQEILDDDERLRYFMNYIAIFVTVFSTGVLLLATSLILMFRKFLST